MTISINNFARRQTPESPYSHYAGGLDALCALVEPHLDRRIVLASDEDGQVIKVTLPGEGFFTGMVQAAPGMIIKGIFAPRAPGEHPYLQMRASMAPSYGASSGSKIPAVEADIILYSHSKLAKKGEHSTDAPWEIVSINAKRIKGDEPPHPVTMMRNQKDYPGGTKMSYTAEQWAEAVEYWLGGGPSAPYLMLDV